VANEPFTYRLKLPDGYRVPPHTHPADAHLTVIAGTLNIGFGDKLDVKATKPMPAGSFIVIPRGAHHYYWTRGETIVQSQGIGPWGWPTSILRMTQGRGSDACGLTSA